MERKDERMLKGEGRKDSSGNNDTKKIENEKRDNEES